MELKAKLKKFMEKNPGVDISTLFENEKTDRIRKELHKQAFQQYK